MFLPALPDLGARDWDPHINIHRNDPQTLIFPIRTTYLEAIDRANHHVYLTHAYFIPDRIILRALLAAAHRGVDVRILLPATSNHVLADWLARGYYMQCLKGGIHLLLCSRLVCRDTCSPAYRTSASMESGSSSFPVEKKRLFRSFDEGRKVDL